MAKPRVDPALVPFLDALAEVLVARLLRDESEKRAAGEPAEVVALPARSKAQPNVRPRKRARAARR